MTVLLVVLALFVGISLGLLGGGGSILTLPLLVFFAGLAPKDAVASSLFIVGIGSAAALVGHAREGRVRYRLGVLFGAASMAGAFAGGRLSHLLPANVLLGGFSLMMLATGLAMLRPRTEPEVEPALSRGALARALAAGVGIGVVTGLVGAGGGFVIVPALVLLCAVPMRAAVGTSLLVITMNSFAGFVGSISHAVVPWALVSAMAAAGCLGAALGARFAGRVSPAALRKGFAWLVLAMTAFTLWKQLPSDARSWMRAVLPASELLGGAMIGLSASLLLLFNGRVAGISGIYASALGAVSGDRRASIAFVLGLVAAGLALRGLAPAMFESSWTPSAPLAAVAGVVVGAGTQLGAGCTSGHGVCGVSRLARRSLVATATFMVTGFVTVLVVRHVLGGSS